MFSTVFFFFVVHELGGSPPLILGRKGGFLPEEGEGFVALLGDGEDIESLRKRGKLRMLREKTLRGVDNASLFGGGDRSQRFVGVFFSS